MNSNWSGKFKHRIFFSQKTKFNEAVGMRQGTLVAVHSSANMYTNNLVYGLVSTELNHVY